MNKIKFCAISPLNHLDLMLQGDMIFALAHLFIQNSSYREFIHDCKDKGWYIIMDNGAAEYSLVKSDILLQICKDLRPSEVICPDSLFNKNETLANLDFARDVKLFISPDIKVMGVPQGVDVCEWLSCYKEMLEDSYIDVIGLSKISVPHCFLGSKNDEDIMESRHLCFKILRSSKLIKKPIHLLGAGNPNEFSFYNNHPLIRSNDTCNWIWSAINDIVFKEGNFQRIKTPHDYFERKLSNNQINKAIYNIEWVKNSIKSVV